MEGIVTNENDISIIVDAEPMWRMDIIDARNVRVYQNGVDISDDIREATFRVCAGEVPAVSLTHIVRETTTTEG